MHWVAPSEEDAASATLEKRLRPAADQFHAAYMGDSKSIYSEAVWNA